MAKFEKVEKSSRKSEETKPEVIHETHPKTEADLGAAAVRSAEEATANLDALLDEINGVLETNAEDFVKSYVQKGGE